MSSIEDLWQNSGQSACSLLTCHLPELQAEAQRLGLKKTGRKGELIDRIDNFYRTHRMPNDPGLLPQPTAQLLAIGNENRHRNDGDANNKRPLMALALAQDDRNVKRIKITENNADDETDDNVEALLINHLNSFLVEGETITSNVISRNNSNQQCHDWCCETDVDLLPLVTVYGCELKYPCDTATAASLVRLSTPARYDVGDESVLDFNVCNCWQIADRSAIKFINNNNASPILLSHNSTSRENVILEAVRRILAPQCPRILAKFEKCVTFPKGSFFKQHRDPRRHINHFGSLLVHLPSHYNGGQFTVRNGELPRTFQFSVDTEYMLKCHVMAFLVECDQEVRPILEGCRVTLNYQLYYCNDDESTTLDALTTTPVTSFVPPSLSLTAERRIADAFYQLLMLPKWRGKQAGVLLTDSYELQTLKPISLQGQDRLFYNSLIDFGGMVFDVQFVAVQFSPQTKQCRRLRFLPSVKSQPVVDDVTAPSSTTTPISNNNQSDNNNSFESNQVIDDVILINSRNFEHSNENQSVVNSGVILVKLKNSNF